MKLLSLLLFISFWAQANSLQVGDVIVQSFSCYQCQLIQDETNSPFVHSGVVLKDQDGRWQVAEALGPVGLTPIDIFLKRGRVNVFLRPKEFLNLSVNDQVNLEIKMRAIFFHDFVGLAFDPNYLWDNLNQNNQEMLYCAEFVVKFLNRFLNFSFVPEPMSFRKNYNLWKQIFKGPVPDGQLGFSPAGLYASELLIIQE